MSSTQVVWLAVAAVLLFWIIGAHNRLVALRNTIAGTWQPLDALLARRHALVESLLVPLRRELPGAEQQLDAVLAASVQAMACVQAVRIRPSAAPAAASLAMADGVFGAAMARLLGRLDGTPQAASRDDVAPLLAELMQIESRLAYSRQAFNDAASAFNDAAQQFPTRLLSRLLGLRAAGRL